MNTNVRTYLLSDNGGVFGFSTATKYKDGYKAIALSTRFKTKVEALLINKIRNCTNLPSFSYPRLLAAEHQIDPKTAQQNYEGHLLLQAKARLTELHYAPSQYPHTSSHQHPPGNSTPVWTNNEVGSEVLYRINPDFGVNLPSNIVLTFAQLMK